VVEANKSLTEAALEWEVRMADYNVDRFLLEGKSTKEILRILREERDDYTPEALTILEEILEARGVGPDGSNSGEDVSHASAPAGGVHSSGRLQIMEPRDAVPVLNSLLNGVLSGNIDPQAGQVAANIVMVILQALEREFMTDSELDTGIG
jgi:hypothetical protein